MHESQIKKYYAEHSYITIKIEKRKKETNKQTNKQRNKEIKKDQHTFIVALKKKIQTD